MELMEFLKGLDPRAPIHIRSAKGLHDISGFVAYPNPALLSEDKLPRVQYVCPDCKAEEME